jgi:hypothetical protein
MMARKAAINVACKIHVSTLTRQFGLVDADVFVILSRFAVLEARCQHYPLS